MLVSGPPGSGKTFLIKLLCQVAKQNKKKMAVTSTTAITAYCLPGGQTFYSWLGHGPFGKRTPAAIARKIVRKAAQDDPTALADIRATDVLLIEEVSMLHARDLGTLLEVLRILRRRPGEGDKSRSPTARLQIVLVGDFFQLPPVTRDEEDVSAAYVFNSPHWKRMNLVHVPMCTNFRHSGCPELQRLLRLVRTAEWVDLYEIKKLLGGRTIEPPPEVSAKALRIFTTNDRVAAYNSTRIRSLNQPFKTFSAKDSGDMRYKAHEKIARISEHITLCVGARVMHLVNRAKVGLFNGSQGTVTGFSKAAGLPRVLFDGEDRPRIVYPFELTIRRGRGNNVVFSRAQVPLVLAFAVTAHKCQGMTLEHGAVVDLAPCFAAGLAYVALSRVRRLSDLYVVDVLPKYFRTADAVKTFMASALAREDEEAGSDGDGSKRARVA